MKCFYHSADLDGHCSGAIILDFYAENKSVKPEMYGVNYGSDNFVEEIIKPGEIVFMADYSLQPFSRMVELSKKCELIWIDHHKTAIDDYKKSKVVIDGIQRVGIGACALTWEYIYSGNEHIPESVLMLAEYDVWNHSRENTLAFQYGLRMLDTFPTDSNMELWEKLFFWNDCNNIIQDGKAILNYENKTNKKLCEVYSFYTEFEDNIAICINRGLSNSKIFDSINPATYDIMITFSRSPRGVWLVSLYSKDGGVDVGTIAKKYGGGGHANAAGFQCKDLPFDY